jgi:hypothetical protein
MAGQLRVDEITDEAGTGSPDFINGIQVEGTQFTSSTLGGNYVMQTFTSPATWTKPAGLKAVKVTVVGAGGNGGAGSPVANALGGGGGGGGVAIKYIPAPSIPGPVTVTQGTAPSKTSSFGAFVSATGGGNGVAGSPGGSGTPGPGGTGSGGDLNFTGQNGGNGPSFGAAGFAFSLGSVPFPSSPTIKNGALYGGGGAGGSSSAPTSPAGTGAAGVVIVEEFY